MIFLYVYEETCELVDLPGETTTVTNLHWHISTRPFAIPRSSQEAMLFSVTMYTTFLRCYSPPLLGSLSPTAT